MRKIIPNLLAVLAVLNLVWLFVFNYRMPSFFTKIAGREEQSIEQEAGQQETNQQSGQQETAAAQAPAEQTGGQAAGEAAEGAAENPAGTGDAATQAGEAEAQAGETISLEGQRTCRPADGNTPNIRSGPGSDYGVIRMAAYDEVMIVRGEAEGGWLPIQTQDGLEGYIYEGMLIIDEVAQ
jgi:hypothetical protein